MNYENKRMLLCTISLQCDDGGTVHRELTEEGDR